MLIDSFSNKEYRYEFYLCKSFYPHDIMSCLTECSFERSLKIQLMSVDELEISIANIYNDGSVNESFELVQIASTIRVETYIDDTLKNTQLFHIYQLDQISGDKDIKSIKGYSLEYRFNKLKVRNFKATTYLYKNVAWNPSTPSTSGVVDYLLGLLQNTYTVSYVSASLLDSARTYDISESNILDVINTIQSNYNAIFFYDTVNRTIQIKSIDELNEYSGIVLSTNNYIKEYKNSIKMDEIYTRLYVNGSGSNSTGISSVNVTGQPYIDNFSSFMTTEFMSQGLITSLTTLNNLRLTKQIDFTGYLSTLLTKQGELDLLNVDMTTLLSERKIIENHEDICIKTGSTSSGLNYTSWHTQYLSKNIAITNKQSAINSKQTEINVVNGNIATLVNLVSYETNLTLGQRQELLNFINETSIKFDCDEPETLMLLGVQLLNIKSSFQYDIQIDMVDIYSAQSESVNWENIVLGKKANITLEDINVNLEPMIVAITHNYDSSSLSVNVSNKTYLNGDLEYISAIFAQSKKMSVVLENEKDIYKEFDTVKDTVIYDTTPISTTNNPITLEDGSALLRRGIYMRDSESANGQMKILGDRIVFTKNNWDTISVGINSNGITTNGNFKLITENLYGLNNLLTLDGNGIKIYGNGVSGDSISIYNKANQQTFGLDSNGNIVMTGSITITGGSGIGSFTDAGDLATANSVDFASQVSGSGKPDNNATVGASWGTNLLNIPGTLSAPSGTGLFLSSTNLGFLSSGVWKTYMDNSGNFYLGGTSGKLQWNAGTNVLTINGGAVVNGTISIGGGDSIFKADSNGIYLGNGSFANAKFKVTPDGAATMTNATITGTSGINISSSITVGEDVNLSGLSGAAIPRKVTFNGQSSIQSFLGGTGLYSGLKIITEEFKLESCSRIYGDWNFEDTVDFTNATVTGFQVQFA